MAALKKDGKIYRSVNHPLGQGVHPDYEIGPDCLMYRTQHHPDGRSSLPEYEVRELARQALNEPQAEKQTGLNSVSVEP